jgi:hypothetical protein
MKESGIESGIDLIAKERSKQLETISVESDRVNCAKFQLIKAACALLLNTKDVQTKDDLNVMESMMPQDWIYSIWKNMIRKPYKERLIIAGALIAAEIDRIATPWHRAEGIASSVLYDELGNGCCAKDIIEELKKHFDLVEKSPEQKEGV